MAVSCSFVHPAQLHSFGVSHRAGKCKFSEASFAQCDTDFGKRDGEATVVFWQKRSRPLPYATIWFNVILYPFCAWW